MANGKATAGSDVDLLVLGDVGFAEVVKRLHPLQQQLGREINPKVYTLAEWSQLLNDKQAFASDVMSKPKLYVVGDKDDIG